jgi:hypothetical protein
MKTNTPNPNLISRVKELKSAPARDLQAAAHGRSRFLAEASQLREAASIRKSQRHNGWNLIFRKEMPVMKAIISTLIVLVLFASTTTVFAAQNDLPTEPLYGVKTFSEDASLWLTINPNSKLERLMELAQLRVQEIATLTEQGVTIPEQVVERLRQHMETALQLAAGQGDENMQASLLQIQSQLRMQEQAILQLQTRASENDQPVLEQARIMTQEQLRLADQGLEDPLTFRNHYQFQNQFATETSVPTLSGIPSETATATPEAPGYGPGPNSTVTPGPNSTPGAGYGPGPNPTPGGNGNESGSNGGSGGGGGGKP